MGTILSEEARKATSAVRFLPPHDEPRHRERPAVSRRASARDTAYGAHSAAGLSSRSVPCCFPAVADVLTFYAPPLVVARLLGSIARNEPFTAASLTPYL